MNVVKINFMITNNSKDTSDTTWMQKYLASLDKLWIRTGTISQTHSIKGHLILTTDCILQGKTK